MHALNWPIANWHALCFAFDCDGIFSSTEKVGIGDLLFKLLLLGAICSGVVGASNLFCVPGTDDVDILKSL